MDSSSSRELMQLAACPASPSSSSYQRFSASLLLQLFSHSGRIAIRSHLSTLLPSRRNCFSHSKAQPHRMQAFWTLFSNQAIYASILFMNPQVKANWILIAHGLDSCYSHASLWPLHNYHANFVSRLRNAKILLPHWIPWTLLN